MSLNGSFFIILPTNNYMYLKGTLFLKFLLLQFFFLVLFPNFLLALPSQNNFSSSSPEQFLSKMSLDEKLGQLFIVGFPQDELDQQLKEHVEKYHIGSFIFFKRNMRSSADTKKFTQSLQSLSLEKNKAPALIAIDQEGGNVTRIETKPRMPYFSILVILTILILFTNLVLSPQRLSQT